MNGPVLLSDDTRELNARAREELARWAEAPGDLAPEALVRRLGAHLVADRVEFGFWVPHLAAADPETADTDGDADAGVDPDSLVLELFTPLDELRFAEREEVEFRVDSLPVSPDGEFVWAVVSGARVGGRDRFGSFYWLRYRDRRGRQGLVRDPLAYSFPYGVFAPAELYDPERHLYARRDLGFFRRLALSGGDEVARFGPPGNILQIHVATATEGGTLADLTDLYRHLAAKVERDDPLEPAEQNLVGYDAVQLLPVEPVAEPRDRVGFWTETARDGATARVVLRRPDTTNWGYDTVIAGAAAVNPALLRSGRPDELSDLAETLHNFPGKPIRLLLDLVFGHADNQALELLPAPFFAGPNRYGQNLDLRQPTVRAILLEMQRRKVDHGADGVRVDAAQDFKVYDAARGERLHDDAYLRSMSALVQRAADIRYRPFMIFEDGRPWPRPDWEAASTFRDVIEDQPHAFQWGPLTFSHNTPHLEGFWEAMWWRIEQIAAHGGRWIGGCANHDTLRRGYQISPQRAINFRLGDDLPTLLRRAYDHPAATLLTYGALPGVPMDFVAATMRSPWAFVRNTDDRYGLKVVAEEAGFFEWRGDPERYARETAFARVKALGFGDLGRLRRFTRRLEQVVAAGPYDLTRIADALNDDALDDEGASPAAPAGEPDPGGSPDPGWNPGTLERFAQALMDDLHDYCKVWPHAHELDPTATAFNLTLRGFRRAHPWLMHDFGEHDRLVRLDREGVVEGAVVALGYRSSPDASEEVLALVNLAGETVEIVPEELGYELQGGAWRPVALSPRVRLGQASDPWVLSDAEGVLFYRER